MAKKSTKKTPGFDFRTIKSFEDACVKENIDPTALPDVSMIPEDLRKPIISAYKLMIIFLAINNGWRPDWSKSSQWKYYPWYRVLSSGFGFSHSDCYCGNADTSVGSRLCFESREKSNYAAQQFIDIYEQFLTIKN